MPIFWRCPSCRSLVSLRNHQCRCGTKLPKNGERTYVVQVRFKGQRKSATVNSLSLAREVEARLKNELIQAYYTGQSRETRNLTVKKFCEEIYFPWAETENKSFSKAKIYFYKWIFPAIGNKKLIELTPFDFEKIKTRILQADRAPRTVQHVLALIKAALNKARDWGFFSKDNPVSKVKVPRFDNRRIRFLTPEEAHQLLEECKKRTTPHNLIYPIVLLALSTGMRAGEIFKLKVQDVDLEEEIIHIRDTKSGENRIAFMSEEVKKEISHLIQGKKGNEYVFCKPDGRPFTEVPDVWKTIIRDLKFNEGITDPREKVVFHTLRHTFCSWLAMEGVPLHVIKELAGHKTIQMTERYAHLMPDIRKKAVEKIFSLLKK